jgi:hypothetical protein
MLLESYNCVLCHLGIEESLMRLFFHCLFAMSCWNVLGLAQFIQVDLLEMISSFRE